jgi:hypothetical protein
MEPGVFGLVDNTHAASAKFFDNSIMAKGLANHAENLLHGNSRWNEMKSNSDKTKSWIRYNESERLLLRSRCLVC